MKTADFSTAVGLLKYGFIERKEAMIQHSQNAQKEFGSLFVSQFGQKVKDFFGDMF